MELRSLVDLMVGAGSFADMINDPLAQFGPPTRQYLGATLLPEQRVKRNEYRETWIEFRSNIANASTRYSPPQIKGNTLIGSWLVELAESDSAAEFTSQDYDALIEIIQDMPDVTEISEVDPLAMTSLINWFDTGVVRPLKEFNEKNRFQALVNAQVTLTGDNNFNETVQYYAPSGHRVAAGGNWLDPTYDPYPELIAGYNKLISKGYVAGRFITSREVRTALLTNPKILARLGILTLAGGLVVGLPGMATIASFNEQLSKDSMPPLETYDLQYRTQTGTQFFFPRNAFLMLADTGRDVEVPGDYDRGDNGPFVLPNTMGYVGVGRPANRKNQGAAAVVEYNDKKGAPVKAQGWQTSLPVIQNPEGIYVITNINVTAYYTGIPASYN